MQALLTMQGIATNMRVNILLEHESDFSATSLAKINALPNDHIISVTASLLANDQVLPQLFLTVSMNYTSEGQTTIPVFGNVDTRRAETIRNYFSAQGVEGLKLAAFNTADPGIYHAGNCSLLLLPGWTLADEFLSGRDIKPGALSIIASVKRDDSPTIASCHRQLVSNGKENMTAEDVERVLINEELEKEITLWQKRAALYHDFLPLSKKVQEKEYNDVVAWYHKEYEVLPLWYKRVGHVIKVLTGKRKFRSLFNKKLKQKKT